MLAAAQGVELPPDDDDMDRGDEDLPPELVEMERRFREEKKEAQIEAGQIVPGLGYVVES